MTQLNNSSPELALPSDDRQSTLLSEDFVSKWTKNRILHFDLDCFYAAVEMRDNPALKNVPLAIGGPPNSRSVLCTSNYLARAFGVRSAMSSSLAVKKCPKLVILPPDFKKYKTISRQVFSIFHQYTDLVEGLSLDEAFLDVTELAPTVLARDVAKEIKQRVFKETGLTISAGVSFNKFLAKVASDWKKPDGFYVIPPAHRQSFVQDLDIKYIFGIGQKSREKLNAHGIFKCADIQRTSLADLKHLFGTRYLDMFYMSHGIDFRRVDGEGERKSFTCEETLNEDIGDPFQLMQRLQSVYTDWHERFQKYLVLNEDESPNISTLVVKVKYFDFKQTTHECRFRGDYSFVEFQKLLEHIFAKRMEPMRLLGLGVRLGKPDDSLQMSLL
jgi:DNA polymerase IV